MMQMEISQTDFSRLFENVEKMKYQYDASWLNCCLTNTRLLIIGTHERISEKTVGCDDNVYYGVGKSKDLNNKYRTYATPSEDCIWCEAVQPILLKKEGNYRSVKPRRLLQGINSVNELIKKKDIINKRIVIGMDETFYIKVKGKGQKYEQIASFLFDSDPDIIVYGESGSVNVEWKFSIECS